MSDSRGFGQVLRVASLLAVAGGPFLQGCVRSPKIPLEAIPYAGQDARKGRLLVLLPGYGSKAGDFADHGFVEEIRKRDPSVTVLAADAHFGYYRSQTLTTRLKEDVIGPALAEGFSDVWLVGTSMGGLGTLAYSMRNPSEIDGIILMSPYLGDKDLITRISEAGGPERWTPPEEPDLFAELWVWLKKHARSGDPPIYLAYGREDRLSVANGMLADLLPPDRVVVWQDAGHGWKFWDAIWPELIDRWLVPGAAPAE